MGGDNPSVHHTAIVETGAELAKGVIVGPFCTVGPNVVLGEGVRLISHAVVSGRTTVGARTVIYPFASLGMPPQDLKYRGEPSRLEIGAGNVIREHVTMNPGTEGGGMVTRVGVGGLFMAGAHVAHDCQIGDGVVLANQASLAGHVTVGDFAIIGGLSGVHQFCRVGMHAFVGAVSMVAHDVIPYGSAHGDRARLVGLNLIGLDRRNMPRDAVQALRTAYRLLFTDEGTLSERVEDAAVMYSDNAMVMEIVAFMRTASPRPICQPVHSQEDSLVERPPDASLAAALSAKDES